jgi:hypothetical protein
LPELDHALGQRAEAKTVRQQRQPQYGLTCLHT